LWNGEGAASRFDRLAAYKAKLFINHYKAQTDTLKLLPAFYD
jgi:hypothetical protein